MLANIAAPIRRCDHLVLRVDNDRAQMQPVCVWMNLVVLASVKGGIRVDHEDPQRLRGVSALGNTPDKANVRSARQQCEQPNDEQESIGSEGSAGDKWRGWRHWIRAVEDE